MLHVICYNLTPFQKRLECVWICPYKAVSYTHVLRFIFNAKKSDLLKWVTPKNLKDVKTKTPARKVTPLS